MSLWILIPAAIFICVSFFKAGRGYQKGHDQVSRSQIYLDGYDAGYEHGKAKGRADQRQDTDWSFF